MGILLKHLEMVRETLGGRVKLVQFLTGMTIVTMTRMMMTGRMVEI